MIESNFSYSGLKASTIVAENNISYLSALKTTPIKEPLSSPTMGLMMLLSTLQYQAPNMSPIYSPAASQIGQAAFIEVGGKDFQVKFLSKMESVGKNLTHDIGITDAELGATLGTLKVIRDRQLYLIGPKLYSVGTDLTVNQTSGTIGLKYGW